MLPYNIYAPQFFIYLLFLSYSSMETTYLIPSMHIFWCLGMVKPEFSLGPYGNKKLYWRSWQYVRTMKLRGKRIKFTENIIQILCTCVLLMDISTIRTSHNFVLIEYLLAINNFDLYDWKLEFWKSFLLVTIQGCLETEKT